MSVHLHGATPDMRSKNTLHTGDAARVIQKLKNKLPNKQSKKHDGREYLRDWNGGANHIQTEGQESLFFPQAQLVHQEVDLPQLYVGGNTELLPIAKYCQLNQTGASFLERVIP